MLKCLKYMSENGKKAVLFASLWLGLFQVVCMLPMIMIIHVLSKMLRAYRFGNAVETSVAFYLIAGAFLIAIMFLTYKKMYRMKYINAANENNSLRMGVADKFRRLPESFLSTHDLSDLTSTVMDDVGTIEGVLANQLTEMIGGAFGIGITLIFMYFINVKMALALTAVIPFVVFSMSLSDTVSGKTHMKNRIARVAISDSIQEYLENIRVLKISGNIGTYQKSIYRKISHLIPGLVLFEFLAGMCVSMAFNLLRMGIGIVAIYGAGILAKGEISVEIYITFVLMAVWIYEPLSYTCEHLGAVIASKVAATRIENIMEYPEQTGSRTASFDGYDICFKDVSFSYASKETASKENVLNSVSFTAGQGQYTALVGLSGSGKSTICRLAARLWDYESGLITIGGTDVRSVHPERLFELFSIVFQDVTLFNDTIYNNILVGNRNATRKEVLKAAEDAQCMAFINKLPDGIDTVIGENGHTLSGGERQRLSIARAFLKNAPIVLLDESTASVDPETETKLQAAIEKLTRGKTVLMIAHRLRSVVNCDRIVVLDKGEVVGNGSHETLIKDCDIYKRLYELQCEDKDDYEQITN
ncbi:ABC transporter ATP-binding protein [Butyrivibrio sp. CB08]|uniref:ABC transporter ATP-binding protein n=1 Tax=Butyrivibrio sp. CB08 TaxID=2364879 RepID=UPI000EA93C51|nr:ABC transporter ATP-binding protein [Butyrivibrio sp. CB08]RKM56755.1 ABC transporter ATP-binding protein [Butyrivibrio sp. CB08]